MNVIDMPVTLATALITILALIFYIWTGLSVAGARSKHSVKAPTMTGPLEFECAVRVQANTLEWLVVLVPALWLATIYFSPSMSIVYLSWLPPVLGLVWVIGRVIYKTGYMTAPEKRETGFVISALAVLALIICALIGILMTWSAVSAV
ncbi:MAG TPA: MAPEG family protein [Rhizomicrobium sp.]|jgi:glutathione S-transferase